MQEWRMKSLLTLLLLPLVLPAQTDPAFDAYQAWQTAHRESDYKAKAASLFDVSAEWVKQWPDSKFAWRQRRDALVGTQSHEAELWKQVDEKLIQLNPPHTFAASAAYDWVAADVNLKEAEELLTAEIDWRNARPPTPKPANPTLSDLIDEANSSDGGPLTTLVSVQIKLKQFEGAHASLAKLHVWLDGDFKSHYDQDPLEAFPDYQSKYFLLSADLANAEGRKLDALAFYQHVMTNPYFRREYSRGYTDSVHTLWKQMGGAEEAWTIFAVVPPLPPGVPNGYSGMPFLPWIAVDYKLPEMNLPSLDSRAWTSADFERKATMVYLWASWCGPCRPHLPIIQALYDHIKERRDIQLVTLSIDEDRDKLAAFMQQGHFTFPVMIGKSYADKLLPRLTMGQQWIVSIEPAPSGWSAPQNSSWAALRLSSMRRFTNSAE
jgi:thiol-disulfide isomerase/thioredoxin